MELDLINSPHLGVRRRIGVIVAALSLFLVLIPGSAHADGNFTHGWENIADYGGQYFEWTHTSGQNSTVTKWGVQGRRKTSDVLRWRHESSGIYNNGCPGTSMLYSLPTTAWRTNVLYYSTYFYAGTWAGYEPSPIMTIRLEDSLGSWTYTIRRAIGYHGTVRCIYG